MTLLLIISVLILYQSVGIYLASKEEFDSPIATIFFISFYPIVIICRLIKRD